MQCEKTFFTCWNFETHKGVNSLLLEANKERRYIKTEMFPKNNNFLAEPVYVKSLLYKVLQLMSFQNPDNRNISIGIYCAWICRAPLLLKRDVL